MKKRGLIALIALPVLACTVFVGGPEYPEGVIPVSTEAVQELKTHVKQAAESGAETGTVILQITESQLTSYLAFQLESQSNPLFTDPQVYLRDGQMKIFGKAHRGTLLANMGITLNVTLDEQGLPRIEIASADFGPFPIPQGLNEAVSVLVGEAFTGSLGPVATGFRLDSIIITEGVMTITGRTK